jgi:hypothetical protein
VVVNRAAEVAEDVLWRLSVSRARLGHEAAEDATACTMSGHFVTARYMRVPTVLMHGLLRMNLLSSGVCSTGTC